MGVFNGAQGVRVDFQRIPNFFGVVNEVLEIDLKLSGREKLRAQSNEFSDHGFVGLHGLFKIHNIGFESEDFMDRPAVMHVRHATFDGINII